jgi:hypothetical protein
VPTIAPYANAGGDGAVHNDVAASWATARNAATGTSANPAATDLNVYTGPWDGTQYFRRVFLPFDTSSLPDGDEATAGTLYIYVADKGESGMSSSVCVVASTQASDTNLTTADFDACGTVELTARRTVSSLTVGAYNAFTLNAAGLAAINKTGYTKLCLRTAHDLDNTEVTGNVYSYITVKASDQAGTSNDPYLEITYAEVQRSGGDSLLWTDGTAQSLDRPDGSSLLWTDSPPVYWRAARKVITVAQAGANTTLNGSHSFPQATVTVASTTGFPSSGTVVVTDTAAFPYPETSFTYTGKTATTFTGCTGGSGTFASGKPVCALDAENFFPQINQHGGTNPELLITYSSKGSHAGRIGSRICGSRSTDGGLTWSTPGVIRNGAVNANHGIFGHTLIRLSDGSHFCTWYEEEPANWFTNVRSYSIRCPAGSDPLNPANWDTPVQIPSQYGINYMAVGITGIVEYAGDVYVTAYGIDSGRGDDTPMHHYSKLLKTTDKGATGGNWSVRGTIATVAQVNNRANGEASLVILPDGTWLSHLRCEVNTGGGYSTLDRYQAKSTDAGATWGSHTRIAQNLVNSSGTLRRSSGMLVSQGGSSSGTPTKTIFTSDVNDWSGPSSGVTTEPAQSPYVYYTGSAFASVTPFGPFDAVNAFSGENSTQAGAQVYFQWYEIPGQRHGAVSRKGAAIVRSPGERHLRPRGQERDEPLLPALQARHTWLAHA